MNFKIFFTLCLILAGCARTYGQKSIEDLKKSAIYYYFEMVEGNQVFKYIALKTVLKDTLIAKVRYSKVQWTRFQDYDKKKTHSIQFERVSPTQFTVLGPNLKKIHDLKLKAAKQQGTIFGTKGQVEFEFIDTRNASPGDSFIPENTTPIRFAIQGLCPKSLVYYPRLHAIETYDDCKGVTQYMLGEVAAEVTRGLQNTEPMNADYTQLAKGDAIQLQYRTLAYNDTTGLAEPKKKQLMDVTYSRDTVIEGKKLLVLTFTSFNYGSDALPELKQMLVELRDSVFQINGGKPILAMGFKPMLKVDKLVLDESKIPKNRLADYRRANKNFVSFSAYVYDTLAGMPFPRVVYSQSNSPYTNYVLPYFPISYSALPGMEALVTYVQTGGKKYGTKLPPEAKTDETHIRSINAIETDKVDILAFFLEPCTINIYMADNKNIPQLLVTENIDRPGEASVVVATPVLKNGETYQIEMEVVAGKKKFVVPYRFKAKL
jgi:hypothetical protein